MLDLSFLLLLTAAVWSGWRIMAGRQGRTVWAVLLGLTLAASVGVVCLVRYYEWFSVTPNSPGTSSRVISYARSLLP
jgi:hypothetical protein